MNLCLLLDAEFKLFHDMFAEFTVCYQYSHPVPVMIACQEFK